MDDICLYNDDCTKILKTLPDDTFDLIITSPPYNKGYWISYKS